MHMYPPNYNASQKYPLIIHFSTPELTNYSQYYTAYKKEPVISVDISQRGFTMGSYIGEASILEALEDIFERFSIDKNRVYAFGHSNGAFAAWAMAEAYPDMFAGVIAASGCPYEKSICNLKNMHVINISSKTESDYKNNFCIPHKKLRYHTNLQEILAELSDHNMLVYFLSKENLITDILKKKRELYPNEIEYYSCRNRHRKAYWIELHGIAFSKKFMKANIKITENNINVKLVNATGITITIPPQINRHHFSVTLNSHKYVFENYPNSNIQLVRKGRGYEVSKATPFLISDKYKGDGILGVFTEPLKIITATDDNNIIKCADSFSTPNTNGANPVISIKYPISSIKDYEQLPTTNLIVIDNNICNPLLEQIRQNCNVHMKKDSYNYKNVEYKTDYCIMQLVTHPNIDSMRILYINTSDIDLLTKNFFTRKFIIPTYANGYHPFLNNDALIFDSINYMRIFEYGMDIEHIQ